MKFKKIAAVFGTFVLLGATMGLLPAYSQKFTADVTDTAVVYGANAAATDAVAGNSILAYLDTFKTESTSSDGSTTLVSGDFSSSSKETYDDLVLGNLLFGETGVTLKDNKISSLIDDDFRWDNGHETKTYDVHEEIIINELTLQTTLDNKELNSSVVLENDKGIEYRYVFDDFLNFSARDDDEADTLQLTILGKEYDVIEMGDDYITVSTSDEKIVTVNSVMTVDGVTLTIGDIFEDAVEINGVLIDLDKKKTISGIEVEVDTIAYHSSGTSLSKAVLKVGKDITQTFNDEDEYIEDDETWIWHIVNPEGLEGTEYPDSFIGVKYDRNSVGFDVDEDDLKENAITVGQSYILPENYGAVSFTGLTDVDYEDFELYFDDKKLYDGVEAQTYENDVNVAILEGENDDSITLTYKNSLVETVVETSTIYFEYVPAVEGGADETVNMYFKDIDEDASDKSGRIQLTTEKTATLIVGDTEITVKVVENKLTLNGNGIDEISIDLGKDSNGFIKLGPNDEDANSDDVKMNTEGVGTREDDVMDHYGIILKDPEDNADDDKVVLSIPSEQVFATVTVNGQGQEVTTTVIGNTTAEDNSTTTEVTTMPTLGSIIVTDSELESVKNKNLIVVGGSCINSVAASLLSLPANTCAEDFTTATGVGSGQYLIKEYTSPYNSDKVALLIAGYHAADTTAATTQALASF